MNAPPLNSPACSVEELQKLCSTLALQHAEVQRERDQFARQIAAMPRSSVDAEKALLSIRQARDTLLSRNHELLGMLTVAEDKHAELHNQHEDLTRAHAAAIAELEALRQEVAEGRSRPAPEDQVPAAAPEPDRGLVAAMADMGRQLASLTEERDDALSRAAELEARAAQSEVSAAEQIAAAQKARDAAIEAAAACQHQIDELIADRDALRTQFKSEQAALHAQIAALHALAAPSPSAGEAAHVPAAPRPVIRKDPGLAALHKRFTSLQEEADGPERIESLEHFSKQLLALSLRGQTAGLTATYRLASVAAEYATWLKRMPAKVNAALPNLGEALDVIEQLCSIKSAERHPDPTGALVYSVDDDVDNCECITMAFEKIAFKTRYAVKPEAALADFTAAPCDLVLLDVDMPGMSGIELQKRIREIPHHQSTPIIFVSGHISAADRVAALGSELNRFVAKPYSLNELGLKALTLIVRSRLSLEG